MIAAVSPTSASSRNGTPAPRSDKASTPAATLSAPLTIRKTVLHRPEIDLSCPGGSAGQSPGVQTEYRADALGADRSRSQDAWFGSGQVQDGRGSLLSRRTGIEIDVDEVAQLPAGVLCVDGGRTAGDVGAGDRHRPDLTQQFNCDGVQRHSQHDRAA